MTDRLPHEGRTSRMECHACPVRDVQCGDCIVPVIAGLPLPRRDEAQDVVPLRASERRAITRLVTAGLVDPQAAAEARVKVVPVSTRAASG